MYTIPHLQNILMCIKIIIIIVTYQFHWLEFIYYSILFKKCIQSWQIWEDDVQDEKLECITLKTLVKSVHNLVHSRVLTDWLSSPLFHCCQKCYYKNIQLASKVKEVKAKPAWMEQNDSGCNLVHNKLKATNCAISVRILN